MEEARFEGSAFPGTGTANLVGKTTVSYNGSVQTIADEAATDGTNTDNPGQTRVLTPDALGRVSSAQVSVAANDTTTAKYEYDGLGNLVSVQQTWSHGGTNDPQSRTFPYNALGRLTVADNPETGAISYRYDDAGNLIEKSDARVKTCFGPVSGTACNATTSYHSNHTNNTYDKLNRPRSKNYTGGTPSVSYTYDTDLAISGHTETNYSKRRLTQVGTTGSTTTYRYDALGRVQSSKQATGRDYIFGYTYTGNVLTSMTYPVGAGGELRL